MSTRTVVVTGVGATTPVGGDAKSTWSALLAGQSFAPDGAPRKRFPARARRLRRWNSGSISSHELAVRLAPVRARGLRFDEGFGAGAGPAAFLGEE